MTECLVRLGHSMCIFLFTHRTAAPLSCVKQLIGQTHDYGLLATHLGAFAQPTHGQSSAPYRAHLNRHLVVGTTNTTTLYLHTGLDVIDCAIKNLLRLFAGYFLNMIQSTIHDTL